MGNGQAGEHARAVEALIEGEQIAAAEKTAKVVKTRGPRKKRRKMYYCARCPKAAGDKTGKGKRLRLSSKALKVEHVRVNHPPSGRRLSVVA